MKNLCLALLLILPLGCQPSGDKGDSNSTSADASTAIHGGSSAAENRNVTEFVFAIDGMQCAVACPPAVKGALESVPGVTDVVVNFESKQATVQANSAEFDQTAAVQSLTDAGFSGRLN